MPRASSSLHSLSSGVHPTRALPAFDNTQLDNACGNVFMKRVEIEHSDRLDVIAQLRDRRHVAVRENGELLHGTA